MNWRPKEIEIDNFCSRLEQQVELESPLRAVHDVQYTVYHYVQYENIPVSQCPLWSSPVNSDLFGLTRPECVRDMLDYRLAGWWMFQNTPRLTLDRPNTLDTRNDKSLCHLVRNFENSNVLY